MAYFSEPKSETLYVTATSIIWKRRPRKMIVESRPEYAVVQLSGIDEAFPVPWEEIFQAAYQRHEANLRLERKAAIKATRAPRHQKKD